MTGAVDNDVLLKGACYGLLAELIGFVDPLPINVGVLGAARFVVPPLIGKARLRKDSAVAMSAFDQVIANVMVLEPTEPEQHVAAAIELAAQRAALPVNPGESQLFAIALNRGLQRVLTGDKRAIAGLEELLASEPELAALAGRTYCLEQAVLALSVSVEPAALRSIICSEPDVDRALSICFSCYSAGGQPGADYAEGLRSYITALRADAPQVLAP